jgi:excisionase family DNA binding protein
MSDQAPAVLLNCEAVLLRREEVARRLNVSRSKAQSLMQSGALPVVRMGGCVRVRPYDLEAFIERSVR